jgi:hypothetical protein
MRFFKGMFVGTVNRATFREMVTEALDKALKSGKEVTIVISDGEEEKIPRKPSDYEMYFIKMGDD